MADVQPGTKAAILAVVIALSAAGYGAWSFFEPQVRDIVPFLESGSPTHPVPTRSDPVVDIMVLEFDERVADVSLMNASRGYEWRRLTAIVNPCSISYCPDGVMDERTETALRIALVRQGWYEPRDEPGRWRHDTTR